MLVIRDDQMEAMSAYMLRGFKARMTTHLAEVLPAQSKSLGPEGVGAAIDRGVARARELAIITERDVARYLDLRVALGADADVDSAEGWAGKILTDKNAPAEERLGKVFDQLPARAPASAELAAWWAAAP